MKHSYLTTILLLAGVFLVVNVLTSIPTDTRDSTTLSARNQFKCVPGDVNDSAWKFHSIAKEQGELRGADGIRIDQIGNEVAAVVPWEEGKEVHLYIKPNNIADEWTDIRAGAKMHAIGVEDAVLTDIDGDGLSEIISATEQDNRLLLMHSPDPAHPTPYHYWTVQPFTGAASKNEYMDVKWMYSLPVDIDDDGDMDIIAGSKFSSPLHRPVYQRLESPLVLFVNPGMGSDIARWNTVEIGLVGWTMSIHTADVDQDGYQDIIISDRKDNLGGRGLRWFQNPGKYTNSWEQHSISPTRKTLFADIGYVNDDACVDLTVGTESGELYLYLSHTCSADGGIPSWTEEKIVLPKILTGENIIKSARISDIDRNGEYDILVALERTHCPPETSPEGIFWIERVDDGTVRPHSISGPIGTKFDAIELYDIDADGDLDVFNTNESISDGLWHGVFWFENPIL